MELYAIRLEAGSTAIALLRSSYDPFDKDELLHFEILDAKESEWLMDSSDSFKWQEVG